MNTPAPMPEDWKATRPMKFGQHTINCELVTEEIPTEVHRENFSEIQRHWDIVWPKAESKIKEMLASYERPLEIKAPLYTMEIRLPEMLIEEGVSWSISAVIHDDHGGWWNCEFDGWDVDDDASQPYF